VGVVGFSLGASKALLLAARRPAIRAVVAYYGTYDVRISKFASVLPPGAVAPSPVDTAGQIQAAVLLLNAEQDDETPPDQTERMVAALQGKTFELVRYPKGRHMFEREPQYHPPGNRTKFGTITEYDADAARDSWQRTLAWLRKYLARP
jgi:dienelactone hydrolase